MIAVVIVASARLKPFRSLLFVASLICLSMMLSLRGERFLPLLDVFLFVYFVVTLNLLSRRFCLKNTVFIG
jgi:hypothetical protein